MNVQPDHKQTEVGKIPGNWSTTSLGKMYLISAGGDFDPSRSKDYQDAHFPYPIYSNGLTNSGLYGFCSYADHNANSITITARGVLGSANFRDHPFTAIGRVIVLEPKHEQDGRYFAAYINERVKFAVESTGVPQLTVPQIAKYLVPIPPVKEQRAIANALSNADALVDSLDDLIAKRRDLKQAAMQQLLTGKIRLPGFGASASLTETGYGAFPNDWELRPLRELIDGDRRIRYGIVQPGTYAPSGRYMIRGQDYSEAKGWADAAEFFRVSDKIERRYQKARVRTGDIIMTIVGYCGHVETVPHWLDGANLTQTTARISIDPRKATPAFCKYALQTELGRRQVALYLKGNAQPGLNCGDVERFVVAMPSSKEEQNEIAGFVSDIDAELAVLKAKSDKARAIKQGMMQELLTGRIRLV